LALVTLGAMRLASRDQARQRRFSFGNVFTITGLGGALILFPSWLMQENVHFTAQLAVLGIVLLAGFIFQGVVGRVSGSLADRPTYHIRRAIACAAVLAYAALQAAQLIPLWAPR